jgi:hypothetical protein
MAMTKYEKQAKKYIDPYRKKAMEDALKLRQQKAQDTRKIYDEIIFEAGRAYEDQYRNNAVQKAINERQVAESMANMGLSDSGLNRTQATAVQLSYGNNKAAIDRAKRQAQDSLELKKTSDLATIKQGWLSNKATINQNYDKLQTKYAQNLETAAAKNSAKATKSVSDNTKDSESTKYKVRTYGGSYKDNNGNTMYYFYDENGSKKTYPAGTNPYTGKPITGGYTAEEIKEYGGVWNGYQPKGVKYNGHNYGKVEQFKAEVKTESGARYSYPTVEYQGHEKKVWKTNDGRLWIWDDEIGNYIRAEYKNGEVYVDRQ